MTEKTNTSRLRTKLMFWTCMLIAQVIGLFLFKDLADMSQWVVQGSREAAMTVWYNRIPLAVISVIAILCAVFIWAKTRSGVGNKGFYALLLLFTFNFYVGMINPHLMMRPRQHDAVWVDVEQAKRYLANDESVIVYEIDGIARAHADKDALRPHVIGGEAINGTDVVMTYCGLTNLGMAYIPEIDGKKLELAPINQLENNLVMYDRHSGEPIQQLWGKTESDVNQNIDRGMQEVATFRMPFSKFVQAYPQGEVFINDYLAEDMRTSIWKNPVGYVYDSMMHFIFSDAIVKQHNTEEPVFPTIKHYDNRLPNKTWVWGFDINGDYVAYTEEFVRAHGNLINTTVGDKAIVVAYDETYESLGIYYNTTGEAITTINFFGETGTIRLPRVETVKAGAFWVVWANFFPHTDLNRV